MKKLSLLLALIMLLTACKTSSGNLRNNRTVAIAETVTNVYRTTFVDLPEDYRIRGGSGYHTSFVKDDRIYFLCNSSGLIPISENEAKYTEINSLYSFDAYGNNAQMIQLETPGDFNDGIYNGVNIVNATISPDNNFIVLAWDYDKGSSLLMTCSPDGELIDAIPINNIPQLNLSDVRGMVVNDGGDVIIASRDGIYIVKNNQTVAVKINAKADSNAPGLAVKDGTVFFYDSIIGGNNYIVNIDELKVDKYNISKPGNISSQQDTIANAI